MAVRLALGGSIKPGGCWTPGFRALCICNIETTLPQCRELGSTGRQCRTIHSLYLYLYCTLSVPLRTVVLLIVQRLGFDTSYPKKYSSFQSYLTCNMIYRDLYSDTIQVYFISLIDQILFCVFKHSIMFKANGALLPCRAGNPPSIVCIWIIETFSL